MFQRNNVKTHVVVLPAVATDASAMIPFFKAPGAGEVVGLRFIASSSQPNATTTASALDIKLYKNASHSNSVIAAFNTSGTGLATNAAQTVTLSTTTSLRKFASADLLVFEVIGGAAMGSTIGAYLNVDYVYGYEN